MLLPLYHDLNEEQQGRVVVALGEALEAVTPGRSRAHG
jgi:hypothetical protein